MVRRVRCSTKVKAPAALVIDELAVFASRLQREALQEGRVHLEVELIPTGHTYRGIALTAFGGNQPGDVVTSGTIRVVSDGEGSRILLDGHVKLSHLAAHHGTSENEARRRTIDATRGELRQVGERAVKRALLSA